MRVAGGVPLREPSMWRGGNGCQEVDFECTLAV